MRKYEGAITGVADLILLFPRAGKRSLCIEMKTPHIKGKSAGVQSSVQRISKGWLRNTVVGMLFVMESLSL